MNIWYQSLGRLDAWGAYPRHLDRIIDEAKLPETRVTLRGTTRGVAEHHAALSRLAANDVVANLHMAIAEDADAFVIGNFLDVALDECLEIAPMPVLGLGRTSVHLAGLMGASYGLVCPNEKYATRLTTALRGQGLDGCLAGVATLKIDRLTRMSEAFADAAALDAFVEAFHTSVARDLSRAEVIIPAGGVVMALLALANLHVMPNGAPVLNGIAGLVAMAETAVRLARLNGGGFVSRRLTYAPPAAAERDEILRYYGDSVYPARGTGS